jgi:hypothetical protein
MSETETKPNPIVTFLDAVGRTIVGERVESQETEALLPVKNPVVLHVVPQDQSGRMSVQLLPIFFREFLADKSGDVTFFYKKEAITSTDIETVDFRLKGQYEQMFNKSNLFVPPSAGQVTPAVGAGVPNEAPEIVNLFDE